MTRDRGNDREEGGEREKYVGGGGGEQKKGAEGELVI